MTPPVVPAGIALDLNVLKGLSTRSIALGDRIFCASDSAAPSVVSAGTLQISDTTIVDWDDDGILYAQATGDAWISWTQAGVRDSALVTVVPSTAANFGQWTLPALPAKVVDVRYPRGRGRTVPKVIRVVQGGDLQAALNSAQPGDEVVLASGATFTGNFTLPAKSGNSVDWIVIRAEVLGVAAGTRNNPTANASAAKVMTSNSNAAITTAPGAHHWRLVGFTVGLNPTGSHNNGIIRLGQGNEATVAELPTDIVLDRMVVRGSATGGTSRCVAFNGARQAVIDSWLDECHAKGSDAQAVGGWGGPGPYLIENNHMEASGEVIMFGGADARIVGMVPSDITIRRNHLTRPMTWARGKWSVKNIFELKNAQRVLFEGNVLENNWVDGQTGFAILLKAVSQANVAPWSTMQDVTIRNNIIRNSTSGVNIAYRTGTVPTQGTARVAIINNLFENVGRDPVVATTNGRVFQIIDECQDLTIINNTTTSTDVTQQAVYFDGAPTVRTNLVNNVFPNSWYGIFGTGKSSGNLSIATFMSDGTVAGNVLPGQLASRYPANNFFPPSGVLTGLTPGLFDEVCTQIRNLVTLEGIPSAVGAECLAIAAAVRDADKLPPN